MYNDSGLVEPGHKAKSMKFDEVDAPGPDGTTKKVKVLSIEGEDGKIMRVPAEKLDALEQQFGATYQKVGNAIVRINRDGTTTPVYEATEAGANSETGDIYYKKGPKAGQVATPAAAGGINPRPGGKEAARIDEARHQGARRHRQVFRDLRVLAARREVAAGLQRSGRAHGRAGARRHGPGEGGESGRARVRRTAAEPGRHAEGCGAGSREQLRAAVSEAAPGTVADALEAVDAADRGGQGDR
jgi:hypothetical protein